MKLPKPDRYSVITLGLGAVGGGGLASDFTVLQGVDDWVAILMTAVTIGVLPVVGGWVSPKLWYAVLFPVGMAVCLALVSVIWGPLSTDISSVGLVVIFTVVYGGGGAAAFGAGWGVRWVLGRLRGGTGARGTKIASQ